MTDFRQSVVASLHTVAVPSGIHTRFSSLLWSFYRFHRHSNGIFTYGYRIPLFEVFVNWRLSGILQEPSVRLAEKGEYFQDILDK